jgi:DNA-binding transcriptional LysR family regulator
MDIELRLLRSFALMHEAGLINRAAEWTACTQAAMSMRLKVIETEPASLPPCAQVWR